jgi:hypothetical protein
MRLTHPCFVLAGLDPATFVLLVPIKSKKDVDARLKAGMTKE